nr:hypothetical protein [uncultured Arsenicibacter sp.]
MKHPLEPVQKELRLHVKTFCSQLRKRDFKNPRELAEGSMLLVRSQMLVDEIGHLMHYHQLVTKALENCMVGLPFAGEGRSPGTVYQYCRYFFEEAECRLGSATAELRSWLESLTERDRRAADTFERLFGSGKVMSQTDSEYDPYEIRSVSESDRFSHSAGRLLSAIEQSNALRDYNEHMTDIHRMLLMELPVAKIHKAMSKALTN